MPFRRLSSRLKALQQRFAGLSGNVRGAIWILIASLGFSAMAVCIKAAGANINVWVLVFLRSLIALVILSPAIIRAGPRVMHTKHPRTHLLRSCLGMGGMICFFMAITHLDLTLATTLGFTRVLFIILLALLFLGERIRWRRTLATLTGFVGVLVCIQPGGTDFDPWTLAGLAGSLFAAGSAISIKRLTRTDSPLTIMLWAYVVMGIGSALPLPWMWITPNLTDFGLIAASALFSTWGQSAMVLGLRAGEATVVAPFEYTRLLYTAGLGYLLFAEVPSASTWLGGGIIIVSTGYIGLREAALTRAKAAERAAAQQAANKPP